MTEKHEQALRYIGEGRNVIPTGSDKKPLISWEKWINERVTEIEVNEWWGKYPDANPAIITGKLSGIVVIDIDGPEGEKEFFDFMGPEFYPETTLTVKTPRGGQHYYYKYPEKEVRNTTNLFTKVDVRGEGGYVLAPPSTSNTGRYSWLDNLATDTIPIPQKLLDKLTGTRVYTPVSSSTTPAVSGATFQKGSRDNDIFHLCCQFAKAGMPKDEARNYARVFADHCTPPFPYPEMERKLDSAYERYARGERNLVDEIKDWIVTCDGVFHSNDLKSALFVTDKKEKKHVDVILGRLKSEGLVEKHGDKRGFYRPVVANATEIDIFAKTEGDLEFQFPLGIEEWFTVMPKNILCIAGEPNSGKTGFLLSFAQMNMDRYPVNYFSSEMSVKELQSRLKKFEMPYENWKKVKFYERSSNFVDVIKPNEVNIIDFLELSDDFYRLSGIMTEIYNKLELGICFIAIQKNKGNDFGLGGQRGLEKPRLYCTMSTSNIFKMVKVKNWREENKNPNGLACEFRLYAGHSFHRTTPWTKN